MRFAIGVPPQQAWTPKSTMSAAEFAAMLELCDLAPGGSAWSNAWWVDGNRGVDTNDGRSHLTPFLTMAQAFTKIASGDTIYVRGNIREQLTTPAGIFEVSIIGSSNRPRHADAHTGNNGYTAATWKAPSSPTAATPLLKIQQQGWRIQNMLFAAPSDAYAIELFRDAGAGDAERDSGHAVIIGNRFASGKGGITDTGGVVNVLVAGNRFEVVTDFCILGVGNIGVGQSDWMIVDNTFDNFTNGVKIAGFGCRIQNNTFTDGATPNTTVVLNTSNGGGDDNFVVGNFFQTLTANFNTPDIVGNATDVWAVNASINSTAAGVGGSYEWG